MKNLIELILLTIALMDAINSHVSGFTMILLVAAGLFAIADSISNVAIELKNLRVNTTFTKTQENIQRNLKTDTSNRSDS